MVLGTWKETINTHNSSRLFIVVLWTKSCPYRCISRISLSTSQNAHAVHLFLMNVLKIESDRGSRIRNSPIPIMSLLFASLPLLSLPPSHCCSKSHFQSCYCPFFHRDFHSCSNSTIASSDSFLPPVHAPFHVRSPLPEDLSKPRNIRDRKTRFACSFIV